MQFFCSTHNGSERSPSLASCQSEAVTVSTSRTTDARLLSNRPTHRSSTSTAVSFLPTAHGQSLHADPSRSSTAHNHQTAAVHSGYERFGICEYRRVDEVGSRSERDVERRCACQGETQDETVRRGLQICCNFADLTFHVAIYTLARSRRLKHTMEQCSAQIYNLLLCSPRVRRRRGRSMSMRIW